MVARADCDDPAAARDHLIELDADGTHPRPAFLAAARARLGLSQPLEQLLAEYRAVTLAGFPRLGPEIERRLAELRRDGWRIAVVTNGDAGVQEETVQHIGLARHLDACIVSGAVGVRKPDPEIFRLAIAAAGSPRPPIWMVGDGSVDVAGAHAVGVRSIWISRGRRWAATDVEPDAVTADLSAALDLLGRSQSQACDPAGANSTSALSTVPAVRPGAAWEPQ